MILNIFKYKYLFFYLTLFTFVINFAFMGFFGLKLSVDFTGGSVISFAPAIDSSQLLDKLFADKVVDLMKTQNIEVVNYSLDSSNGSGILTIKTKEVSTDTYQKFNQKLNSEFNNSLQVLSFETVGPVVGKETTKKAILAVLLASIGIVSYIAYAFKNVPKPFSSLKFGVSAVVAMLHDVILVLGVFAILGKFFDIEVDTLLITALLTILSFSVHDTIVIFDRIRENLLKNASNYTLDYIINVSVSENFVRSITTSLTIFLTLISLFLLGGESIKGFILALLIGVISGTYSSVFIASPVLAVWHEFDLKRKKSQ